MAGVHLQNNNTVPIKKIRIYPVSSGLREKIYCYFARYGEVVSIDFLCEDDLGYAFVQLKESASMAAVITKREHQIGNDIITVKAVMVHHWYPLDILNALNDDCIQQIFRKLSLPDLCAVAEVCNRFQSNAKDVFSDKFTDFDLIIHLKPNHNLVRNTDDDSESSFKDNENTPIAVVESVFRNFGSLMKSIYLNGRFNGGRHNDQIIQLLASYCSALNKLTLDDFTMKNCSQSTLQQMQTVFDRLQYFGIGYGSHHQEISQLLTNSKELTDMILIELECVDAFVKHKFPKLETIYLRGKGIKDSTLNLVSSSHGQIKNLIINNTRVGLTSNIFLIIGTNLPNLEQLAIIRGITMNGRNAKKTISHLGDLKQLKSLTLDCYGMPVQELCDTLAKGMVPVKHLILSDFELDSITAKSLSKLNHVKELQFNKVRFNSEQLITTLKGMPNLKSLALFKSGQVSVANIKEIIKAANELSTLAIMNEHNFVFETGDFNTITELVKNRVNRIKLTITIGLKAFKLMVSKDVIERNQQWLHIKGLLSSASDQIDDDNSSHSDDSSGKENDEDSEFSGIEDLYYALTTDNDRASGNDPLGFIEQISQAQRKFESQIILRTSHGMGILSQFSSN